jgi:hypothetical protein
MRCPNSSESVLLCQNFNRPLAENRRPEAGRQAPVTGLGAFLRPCSAFLPLVGAGIAAGYPATRVGAVP